MKHNANIIGAWMAAIYSLERLFFFLTGCRGMPEVRGLRCTDGYTKFIADIFRHDSANIKKAGEITPEDMGVHQDGRECRTRAYEYFVYFR